MPFKLTKEDKTRRDEILTKLNELGAALNAEVEEFNDKLATMNESLKTAIEAYNAAVSEARGFCEDISSQADSDIGEKSEKWQEGEKGQAASSWKDEWESATFDDADIELLEPLSFTSGGLDNDDANANTLDELPEAAEG